MMKICFTNFFDLLLNILTLFSKITSKNQFWSIVSLGWKSTNSLISVLNTPGVVLSRNVGSKIWHPFGLLIPISTTVRGGKGKKKIESRQGKSKEKKRVTEKSFPNPFSRVTWKMCHLIVSHDFFPHTFSKTFKDVRISYSTRFGPGGAV